jgi:ubiquinone/menaquinone biosynthesis C-methylase UbiE
MIKEIYRVLKSGGLYIAMSLHKPVGVIRQVVFSRSAVWGLTPELTCSAFPAHHPFTNPSLPS